MNHDRLADLGRERDLRCEDLTLDVARREVVVVVEADLADGHGASPGDGRAGCVRGIGRPARVGARPMRVHGRGEDGSRPSLPDGSRASNLIVLVGRQDAHRNRNAGRLRARVECRRDRRVGGQDEVGAQQLRGVALESEANAIDEEADARHGGHGRH